MAGSALPWRAFLPLPLLLLAACPAAAHPASAESASCASCHAAQASAQPGSALGRAMESIAACDILKTNPLLTFQSGKYSYRIERKGQQSIYTVTDGVQTIAVPLDWAFGLGQA